VDSVLRCAEAGGEGRGGGGLDDPAGGGDDRRAAVKSEERRRSRPSDEVRGRVRTLLVDVSPSIDSSKPRPRPLRPAVLPAVAWLLRRRNSRGELATEDAAVFKSSSGMESASME
jgi:hypothetical protein